MDYIITDLGSSHTLVSKETGEKYTVPRYGVWYNGEVIDSGNDLEILKELYEVTEVNLISSE